MGSFHDRGEQRRGLQLDSVDTLVMQPLVVQAVGTLVDLAVSTLVDLAVSTLVDLAVGTLVVQVVSTLVVAWEDIDFLKLAVQQVVLVLEVSSLSY